MADDFDPYYQWLGIPPKHQPPNHYRLLALEEFESNLDVIENAADQRMEHVRSFQNGPQGEASQRLLNEITAAKLCLLNIARKAEYDQKLRAEKDAAEPRRLKPLPRLVPTSAPTEVYRMASEALSAGPSANGESRAGRRLSPHQAAMAGAGLGVLLVTVLGYITLSRIDWGGDFSPIARNPDDTPLVETKTNEKTSQLTSAPEVELGESLPVGVWCDVLPWVDIAQDAGSGQWQSLDGEVEAAKSEKGKVLGLPMTLEGDYRLAAEFTCKTPGNVEVLIPVGDQGCNVELGGFSGLFWVDGRHTPNNGTGTDQQPLVIGRRHRAEIEVSRAADKASIRVAVDGKATIQWQGKQASLSGWPTGGQNRPAIGAWDAQVRFHRVQVQLVSGKATRLPRPGTTAPNAEQRAPKDYVWIDDDVPAGAKSSGSPCTPDRGWDWVGKPQPVFSGERSMRRSGAGVTQHYFDSVGTGLLVGEGDRLFAYAYLDPASPPASIMLQWVGTQGWAHRAVWGEDLIPWGEPNSPSRRAMGPLPKPAAWVRLEVPIERVGLKRGDVVTGMGFAQHGGTAYWDRVGIVTRTPQADNSPATPKPGASVTSLANSAVRFLVPEEHYAVIRGGEVEAVIVDNEAVDNDLLKGHRLGYHGVASLTHKARPANLFVPAYGGLHVAFIYDGTNHPPEVHSEPRRSPIELRVVSERIVELYQKPTPLWALESAIRYELLDDGVIEMTFECIPRQKTFSKGHIGLYFSSYIDRPESPDMYFLGHSDGGQTSAGWIRAVSPAHGELATHLAAGDRREFPRDPDFPIPAAVNHSKHRYDEPWFYGASHGMAFVQMFRPEDQVRFTQSPIGGGPGNPEWSFNWFIPNYEVGKLYRLVMRAMYVPFDSLHVGLVEPHLRRLNGGAGSPAAAAPKMAYLDDLTEVEFKVGHGTLGTRGDRGVSGPGVPGGSVSVQGRPFAHAVCTHPATGRPAYVVYNLGGQFGSFRALAALSDLAPGVAVRTPVLFKAVADGKLIWTSAPIDRAGAGQVCALDIQGVRALRLEVHSAGDDAFQNAAWLNPLLSTIAEPPLPPFSRESQWVVEGAEFKISETEKGALLELMPGNKLYSKIQIALTKSGTSWGGTGILYFRSSPERRYEAKIEIPNEDLFSGRTLRVRTICPDAAMRTKLADTTSTWTKKE